MSERIVLQHLSTSQLTTIVFEIFSFSICLPMETRDIYDTVYLVLIFGLNFLAFTIIAICYAQIYLSLGHETRHARDNNPGEISVAKKMILLVSLLDIN